MAFLSGFNLEFQQGGISRSLTCAFPFKETLSCVRPSRGQLSCGSYL